MPDTKPHIQEAPITSSRLNVKKKKSTSRHTILKLQKIEDKEKNLKRSQRKHLTCRGARIKITSNFSEIMQTRRK